MNYDVNETKNLYELNNFYNKLNDFIQKNIKILSDESLSRSLEEYITEFEFKYYRDTINMLLKTNKKDFIFQQLDTLLMKSSDKNTIFILLMGYNTNDYISEYLKKLHKK